ncbi:hypothetical protein FTX61_03235 [Nitriliruptoraceae bacterium ZYF776]|nr:hypothetical protein [Profundirhabdus halotolerans]
MAWSTTPSAPSATSCARGPATDATRRAGSPSVVLGARPATACAGTRAERAGRDVAAPRAARPCQHRVRRTLTTATPAGSAFRPSAPIVVGSGPTPRGLGRSCHARRVDRTTKLVPAHWRPRGMKSTRTWRVATAAAAAAGLMMMTAGPAAAQLPDLPGLPGLGGDDEDVEDGEDTAAGDELGLGGFAGFAESSGTTVFVGLPSVLYGPLEPVLDALGVAGTSPSGTGTQGLRIDLARTEADLRRAAAGEDISSGSSAFVTNLLLASGAAGEPGSCVGGAMQVELPPGTPLLTLSLAGVDCEQTDERAFADVEVVGLDLGLANLLELGLPDALADGVGQLIDTLNDALLNPVSEGLCAVLDPLLGVLLPGAVPCEDDNPLLQLRSPFDLDVPVIDLSLIGSDAEVVRDGDTVTATATSTFTGLNVLGVACVGDGTGPLVFTSTATTDGETATREASAPSLTAGLCAQEQSLLRILLGEGPLGDAALIERILQDDLLGGALGAVFDGVDTLLDALSTELLTQGNAVLGDIEGAGTTAATTPASVAYTAPLAGIPGLGDVLGELEISVTFGSTQVGVNALPEGIEPPDEPEDPDDPVVPSGPDPDPAPSLPRTGTSFAAVLGLGALGAAAALRRRKLTDA